MWGGPLRVMLTHEADPSSDVVCFCDVVARDPFFVIGREPRPAFRPADLTAVRLGSVSEVPTPWLCLQDDIRRDGADPSAVARVTDGSMAENAEALRAGKLAANRGLTAYTTLVTRRSVLERKRDELLRMVRAMHQTLRWIRATPGVEIQQVLASYFPDVPAAIYAAAIDRYRALELYGPDPVTRREGFDRLAAAMRSGGALKHDVSFEACVDNSLAEHVIGEEA
jgi:NitT/TauT family transport system substrate-binding protein